MAQVDVTDLLVAVERLVATHRDELDALNVFPVPDADTGHNVLATVRAARVGAEQVPADQRWRGAVEGALRGARGNAGVLTSQLLRALLEQPGGADWHARLVRADELARAAVAHPVEGSFLTAVRAAATAAGDHDDPHDQLRAAVAAAHVAVDESPGLLEVLARAGVVDAGARAAALVLEAVAGVTTGTAPTPPEVEIPPGGPHVTGCEVDDARYEVMYLLDPGADSADAAVRDGLDRIGGSVVVVAADRLISVHVHTDDIGAALDVGLAHGRPHHIRVEDLQEGARAAAAHRESGASDDPAVGTAGVVVGTDGAGLARLVGEAGVITLPLSPAPDLAQLRAAVVRTGRDRVLVLPGGPELAEALGALDLPDVDVVVVGEVDDPVRLLAAMAVLDPSLPDAAALAAVARAVRSGRVVRTASGWDVVTPAGTTTAATALDAVGDLVAVLDRDGGPELVSLLLGDDVDPELAAAAAAAVEDRWPDAELDVVDVGLGSSTFVVGVE